MRNYGSEYFNYRKNTATLSYLVWPCTEEEKQQNAEGDNGLGIARKEKAR